MAIFHLDIRNISRSTGRSVISAAAYRAGEKIFDLRLGVYFDFSRKGGVTLSKILAPENSPAWVYSRASLWNEVEKKEIRNDARLAKEVIVAIPKELSNEDQSSLILTYCKDNFISKGMIADINIHTSDPSNPHAHIMLTTRKITPNGFDLKDREWNNRELVINCRKNWENIVNKYLKTINIKSKISCKSLAERGINLEPTLHLGSAIKEAEKKGNANEFTKYIDNINIMKENGEKIILNPRIILPFLTNNGGNIHPLNVAQLAKRYSINKNQYKKVLESIQNIIPGSSIKIKAIKDEIIECKYYDLLSSRQYNNFEEKKIYIENRNNDKKLKKLTQNSNSNPKL